MQQNLKTHLQLVELSTVTFFQCFPLLICSQSHGCDSKQCYSLLFEGFFSSDVHAFTPGVAVLNQASTISFPFHRLARQVKLCISTGCRGGFISLLVLSHLPLLKSVPFNSANQDVEKSVPDVCWPKESQDV